MLRGIIQYDTLNEVHIRLSDGARAFDYTGYTNIVFKVLKADGTSYVDSEGENVIATSPVDGVITVNLKGQATAAAGLCQSVIEVYEDGGKLTTARFNYEVFEALGTGEETDSESQYPVFQNLMADLSALEAAIESAEAARVTAETARASAASGYVAKAQSSAAEAAEWARQAKSASGGNFAPDGYGLGDVARLLTGDDDLNNVTKTGWYRYSDSTGIPKNIPTAGGQTYLGSYGLVQVIAYREPDCVVQIVYNMYSVARDNVSAMRTIDGTVGEWEWVNPPMAVGVEYRTTERYMGKPVYVKWVSLGTLAAGTKIIEHGIGNIQYVWRYQGLRGNMAMPIILGNDLTNEWTCYVAQANQTAITVYAGASAAGTSVSCILWYTKTTDT